MNRMTISSRLVSLHLIFCRTIVCVGLLAAYSTSANAIVQAVAIHIPDSGTNCFSAPQTWKSFHAVRFLEEALKSDGTPYVELTGSQIDSGALFSSGTLNYPILISIGTECVSDTQINQIRSFASAGGTVFAGGASWTRDSSGNLRTSGGHPTFALSTEMGLVPSGWRFISQVTPGTMTAAINHLNPTELYWWDLPFAYNEVRDNALHPIMGVEPTASSPAEVNLWALNGVGFWQSVASDPMPSGSWTDSHFAVYFANVTGNPYHRDDMIYRVGTEIYVRRSTGAGFGAPEAWSYWSTPYDFTIADVNGDGKADVVGRSGADIQVALSTGSGFASSSSWINNWDVHYDYKLADINGDGKADIIGRNGNIVRAALSTGSAFGPSSSQWTTWSTSYDYQLADVNGDGKADIIGRSGTDIEVGLSTGSSFAGSSAWTSWSTPYDAKFFDVNGDGKADIVGRSGSDVQVGLSTGSGFASSGTPPTSDWTTWDSNYTISAADVDGDGKKDLVGIKVSGGTSGPALGDLEVGLSTGEPIGSSANWVNLARKTYGSGLFIYDAGLVTLAGYGYADKNTEYKIVHSAITEAFARVGTPLATMAPWPYEYNAAMIFRHEHWFAEDVQNFEKSFSTGNFGEYYIQPDLAGESHCGPYGPQVNDYYAQVPWGLSNGAIIGAHIIYHQTLDSTNYSGAVSMLTNTLNLMGSQATSGGYTLPTVQAFTAPAYEAVKQSSLQAIWDEGFKTTGDIGVGPFPHFTIDPESATAYIGALLQIPDSEWPSDPQYTQDPGLDNIERMIDVPGTPGPIEWAAKLSFDMGGLINVYDHLAADPYGYGASGGGSGPIDPCQFSRLDLVTRELNYVKNTLDQNAGRVWYTNSLDIRNWWLQRDRRSMTSVFARYSPTMTAISMSVVIGSPRDTTTFPDTDTAVRVTLDPTTLAQEPYGVYVFLNGTLSTTSCADTSVVRCSGSDLYIKIGSATSVGIVVGM